MTSWRTGDLMEDLMTLCVSSDPMQSVGPQFTNGLTVYTKASERSVMMEAVSDLERMIERRAPREPDLDEREASYMESVRRYHARRQESHRWEWVKFYDRMARNHARLAEEHAARANELLEEGGRG